jgi:hypothetical protein
MRFKIFFILFISLILFIKILGRSSSTKHDRWSRAIYRTVPSVMEIRQFWVDEIIDARKQKQEINLYSLNSTQKKKRSLGKKISLAGDGCPKWRVDARQIESLLIRRDRSCLPLGVKWRKLAMPATATDASRKIANEAWLSATRLEETEARCRRVINRTEGEAKNDTERITFRILVRGETRLFARVISKIENRAR